MPEALRAQLLQLHARYSTRPGDADIGLADRDLLRARTVAHALIDRLRGLRLAGERLRVGLERSAIDLNELVSGVDDLSRPGDDALDDAGRGRADRQNAFRGFDIAARREGGMRLRRGLGLALPEIPKRPKTGEGEKEGRTL